MKMHLSCRSLTAKCQPYSYVPQTDLGRSLEADLGGPRATKSYRGQPIGRPWGTLLYRKERLRASQGVSRGRSRPKKRLSKVVGFSKLSNECQHSGEGVGQAC